MTQAVEWFQKQGCDAIDIYVAEGNERVLGFYEKYGFKRRVTVMRKGKT
jgi:ribosomal protein S18 acetylase RimI-like enzyme